MLSDTFGPRCLPLGHILAQQSFSQSIILCFFMSSSNHVQGDMTTNFNVELENHAGPRQPNILKKDHQIQHPFCVCTGCMVTGLDSHRSGQLHPLTLVSDQIQNQCCCLILSHSLSLSCSIIVRDEDKHLAFYFWRSLQVHSALGLSLLFQYVLVP